MPQKASAGHKSIKHDIIDKTNTTTLVAVGTAIFIVVFSLFAIKALFSQSLYHNRVSGAKEETLKLLEKNQEDLVTLKKSYDAFVDEKQNILGGNPEPEAKGGIDGRNDKLVLDALPDKYDYPALASSFEKILKDGGYLIEALGGQEDSGLVSSDQANAEVVEVPYSFSFTASQDRTKELLTTLERSIRPMYVDSLDMSISSGNINTQLSLHTFFAYPKTFELGSKEVK